MARLPGLRLGGVSAGAGLHPVALSLPQAVLHALNVQAAVTGATLGRTFALPGDVPPAPEEVQGTGCEQGVVLCALFFLVH